MPISIPIHCGFIAYLFLARGKHFPNNIYISYALVCGSFSSALLANAVFGLWATLMLNWRMNWSLPRSAAPTHLLTRQEISRSFWTHFSYMETANKIRVTGNCIDHMQTVSNSKSLLVSFARFKKEKCV